MKRVRAWWARLRAERQADQVERARQQMNEAIENADNWRVVAEIRSAEYERLAGKPPEDPRVVRLQRQSDGS